MKTNYLFYTLLVVFSLALTGCDLIGTIFEAGLWVGIILVVVIVAVVLWLVKLFF